MKYFLDELLLLFLKTTTHLKSPDTIICYWLMSVPSLQLCLKGFSEIIIKKDPPPPSETVPLVRGLCLGEKKCEPCLLNSISLSISKALFTLAITAFIRGFCQGFLHFWWQELWIQHSNMASIINRSHDVSVKRAEHSHHLSSFND